MKKLIKSLVIIILIIANSYGQSDDCSTATPIILSNGTACVNGTTINATSDNVLYSTCNTTSLNEVWYTYTTNGSANTFTVNSLGITNAQIVIYTGGCGVTLETCTNVSGTTQLNATWGLTPGIQVWIGVMSNEGVEGGFELCVDSQAPNPAGGNTCAGAVPICEIGTTYTIDMTSLTSSGVTPSCFLGTGNQDVWITFTVTQAGTIEWSATPQFGNVELDWALYDMSGGCPGPPGGPGTVVACNYNYGGGFGDPVGMNDATSCVSCPTSAYTLSACDEFCTEAFLNVGTYAIMIDQYEGTAGNLDFIFTNGTTALISPVSDFTVSPTFICGPDMTVNITDNSIGGAPDWTFGNGDTYSGSNPPSEYYNTPGTYAITATIPGACPSTHTEYVQLLAPLAGSAGGVDETCPSSCDGSASISSISGGDGVYTYTWYDVSMNPIGQTGTSASGLCAGDYVVQVANATCGSTLDIPVTISTIGTLDDPSFSMTPTCDGGTATVTGTAGGTFSFNTPPGDGATIDPSTGTVTNGTSGATYDILYTTNGTCPSSGTQNVTVITQDDPSFTMSPTCDGGIATITGTAGGTFSFNTPPGDAAVIDPSTGIVSGGTSGNTYDILYTTNGTCPSSSTQMVTASAADDPSFTLTATCDGGTATITGTIGGTFSFNTPPGDAAVIDPSTGTVSGGTPGATYDVLYTTSGACSASSTQQVTALSQDDPTFAMTATCDGGTATITGTAGGTFSFNTAPGDAAVIDPSTGTVSGGTAGATYDVLYTTSGACPATMTLQITALPQDDASFTMTPTCDGGTASVTGTAGGTFSFNTAPGDAAAIDPSTGAVTGGTPGATYDVLYTTNGVCTSNSSVMVTAYTTPPAPLVEMDTTYCSSEDYANMVATGTGGTLTWYDDAALTNSMGTGTMMVPHDFVGTTTYYVTETLNGCVGPAGMVTITINGCDITVPTAITPNNDGLNDDWEVIDLDLVYPDNVVRVYNRWGNLIYEHDSSTDGPYDQDRWDGTYNGNALPVGSYYFIIEFNDKDNGTMSGAVSIIMQ